MDSRQLIKTFARGGACPRPPLLPTAFYHAARVAGTDFAALVADPTRLTRALLDQQALIEADALVVRIDAALYAQAFGAMVDWTQPTPAIDPSTMASPTLQGDAEQGLAGAAVLIDVADRLVKELRRRRPVMAVLPDPVSLARELHCPGTEATAAMLLKTIDGLGRAGVQLVLIEAAGTEVDEDAMRACLAPLANTARYYTASVFLAVPCPPRAKLADGVFLPDSDPAATVSAPVAITIPPECFDDEDRLEDFAARVAARETPCALTATDATLLAHLPERNAAVMRRLRGITFA